MSKKVKHTEAIDHSIGKKIYNARLAKGMSRQQLAEKIEVTSQQLQKYEKGINRLTVSRMLLIAQALHEPFDYFIEDASNGNTKPTLTRHQSMCIEVARNFMKISNPVHQNAINLLVKSLVEKTKS